MPWLASLLSVGVFISPPKVDAWPKPTSSSRMISTFGAPGLRCSGCARRLCTESCSRGAALLADGTGGKGSTEPSEGTVAACAVPITAQSADSATTCFRIELFIILFLVALTSALPTS